MPDTKPITRAELLKWLEVCEKATPEDCARWPVWRNSLLLIDDIEFFITARSRFPNLIRAHLELVNAARALVKALDGYAAFKLRAPFADVVEPLAALEALLPVQGDNI